MSIELITVLARTMPELADYQHFEVDAGVVDFAVEMALEQFPEDPNEAISPHEQRTPISSRLPSSKMTITSNKGIYAFVEVDKTVACLRFCFDRLEWSALGDFDPGQSPRVRDVHDATFGPRMCWDVMFLYSFVIALINEPRIVARRLNGTRQQRRAAQRGHGFAVDAWTRVTWDLSAATVAKISRDPSFHKVPLHWRRGHFRRAEKHWKGALQRPDAIRGEDRDLWWQWIEGQWVGHPAFGLKKSVHAPRLSGDGLARRAGLQLGRSSATARAAP